MNHPMDFLKVVPIHGVNQAVGRCQLRAVLNYRLGIPMFEEDSLCSCCNHVMDKYGDHVIHCASAIGIKFRHNLFRDVLEDICYKAGVAARKEVSMGFLSDTAHALRPANLLVYNWESARDMCFDVTGVSPFTSARTTSYTPGHAISMAVTRKCNKYLDKCLTHGYEFDVLDFPTLGELGEDTCIFLRRLKNRLASQDDNSKVGGSLFHRICITIQNGVGAQLVARLPTNSL